MGEKSRKYQQYKSSGKLNQLLLVTTNRVETIDFLWSMTPICQSLRELGVFYMEITRTKIIYIQPYRTGDKQETC